MLKSIAQRRKNKSITVNSVFGITKKNDEFELLSPAIQTTKDERRLKYTFIDNVCMDTTMYYNTQHLVDTIEEQLQDKKTVINKIPNTENVNILDSNGNLIYFGTINDNSLPQGEHCEFYNRQTSELEYKGGIDEKGMRSGYGEQYNYYEKAIYYSGNFKSNIPDGEHCELFGFNKNLIYKGGIKDGQLHGKGIRYYHTNPGAVMMKGSFNKGVPEGKCEFYDWESVLIGNATVSNGLLNGFGIVYDKGLKKEEGYFINNLLNGRPGKKYKNGMLETLGGHFIDGRPKTCNFYDFKTGKKLHVFTRDTPNFTIDYYSNGQIKCISHDSKKMTGLNYFGEEKNFEQDED